MPALRIQTEALEYKGRMPEVRGKYPELRLDNPAGPGFGCCRGGTAEYKTKTIETEICFCGHQAAYREAACFRFAALAVFPPAFHRQLFPALF